MPDRFTVVVADNFHYMDPDEHYEHGSYDTLESAIIAAKGIVDSCLASLYKPGMTAEQLNQQYVSFGDDPFIRGAAERVPFSARSYAKDRCLVICGS